MIDSEASGSIGGDGQQPFTAADVAAAVDGRLIGPGDGELRGVAPLDRAGPSEISLFSHARYASWFSETRAGAVLVSPELEHLAGTAVARIVVDKPVDAMVKLLPRFHRREQRPDGIHPTAIVAHGAVIGEGVAIEAYAVIDAGVTIANGSWIGAGTTIGAFARIGAHARVHSSVTICPGVEIGDRVVIHSGARIGREGFGFVPNANGIVRIPHVGRCVLHDDVEIGANSCIDRGSIDDTVIGAGTKIDNLVHVAHNVRIGRMCFIAAQTGIAGSVRIGDGTQLGGQTGVNGHITIGSKVNLAGQSGVFGDVPDGETWSGYPARPHREQLRATAALYRLVKIIRPLEELLRRNRDS